MRPGRAVLAALIAGFAVLLAGVAMAMSDSAPRLAGSNNTFDRFPVAEVAPGSTVCERLEAVPGETQGLRLSVEPGTGVGQPLAARIVAGARTIASGAIGPGWAGEVVDIELGRVARTVAGADVCVTNRGSRPVTFRGYGLGSTAQGLELDGRRLDQSIRVTYLRGGSETWWALAPAVAHRMGLGRGELFTSWLAYAWLALVAALAALTARALLREARA